MQLWGSRTDGVRDPALRSGKGLSFILLLLTGPLAGQPQSHTPRRNSSLCLATAASFTLTGTLPLATFWETDLPGSFHYPFQELTAVRKVSLGSDLNTSYCSFTHIYRAEGFPGPKEPAEGKAMQENMPHIQPISRPLYYLSFNIPLHLGDQR